MTSNLTQMVYFNYGCETLSTHFHTHILKQSSATYTKRKIRLDTILKKIIKRQLPFLIGGTITGAIMTYYYGFLFSIIVNSAIWMLISFIVNKYYYKSTGFKDEKYLVKYGLAMINTRTKRTAG